jgi:hypothetical protein
MVVLREGFWKVKRGRRLERHVCIKKAAVLVSCGGS